MICPNCGAAVAPDAARCAECQTVVSQAPSPANAAVVAGGSPSSTPATPERKSRLTAGLLGIFLGFIGIHNFYLGFTGRAILQIVLSCCTCGFAGIWGFVEGILILTGNINADADGVPLQDA